MIVELINIASMLKTRKCAHCGKVFTTNSGMQKYCSEECAEQAKDTKKKRQRDFLRAVEPILVLATCCVSAIFLIKTIEKCENIAKNRSLLTLFYRKCLNWQTKLNKIA